jgi:hypothetical protein
MVGVSETVMSSSDKPCRIHMLLMSNVSQQFSFFSTSLVCLVGGAFLGVSEQVSFKAEEAQARRRLTRPSETLIPTGGTVYASSSEPCPSVSWTIFKTACSA